MILNDGDRESVVTFRSDVIDLSHVTLVALDDVASAVLRAAIVRVREELSGNDGESTIYADFQSSVQARHPDSQD